MATQFVINQVKKIIVSGLKKYAVDLSSSLNKVALVFYTKDDNGTPMIRLMKERKLDKETSFKEMGQKVAMPPIFSLAFNLERDLPSWIQKFLVKCANENNIDIKRATYVMMFREEDNDLHAFMYVDWKLFPSEKNNEIKIEYILSVDE